MLGSPFRMHLQLPQPHKRMLSKLKRQLNQLHLYLRNQLLSLKQNLLLSLSWWMSRQSNRLRRYLLNRNNK